MYGWTKMSPKRKEHLREITIKVQKIMRDVMTAVKIAEKNDDLGDFCRDGEEDTDGEKEGSGFVSRLFLTALYCPTRWAGLLVACRAMLKALPALFALKRYLISAEGGSWAPPIKECDGGDGVDINEKEAELRALDPAMECGDRSRSTKAKHTALLSPSVGLTYTNWLTTAFMEGQVPIPLHDYSLSTMCSLPSLINLWR